MFHALILVLSIQDDLIRNTARRLVHRIMVLCFFMTIVDLCNYGLTLLC